MTTNESEHERQTLLGVQRDPEDEMSEWCERCQRVHQKRERGVECDAVGCSTLTDNFHRLCPRHR